MADKCLWVINQFNYYTIPEFAALWCGVPKAMLQKVLEESTYESNTVEGAMYREHPKYPCLKPRCHLICRAIKDGRLETFWETGDPQPLETECHTSWTRKRLRPDKVIEWLQGTDIPVSELPKFIYEEEPQTEELNAKRENSYRIILYTLLKKIGRDPFPPTEDGSYKFNPNITSWLQNQIEAVGLYLHKDPIRSILQGLQYIMKEERTKNPK